jgi:hypothetical protein
MIRERSCGKRAGIAAPDPPALAEVRRAGLVSGQAPYDNCESGNSMRQKTNI